MPLRAKAAAAYHVIEQALREPDIAFVAPGFLQPDPTAASIAIVLKTQTVDTQTRNGRTSA